MDYAVYENIDRLITLELRAKHPLPLGTTVAFYSSLRGNSEKPLSLLAAERLLEAVKPKDVVLINTGFVLPPWIPNGEIDGLLGAASLARAINYGLRGSVFILSEPSCVQVLRGVSKAAEVQVLAAEEAKIIRPSTTCMDFAVDSELATEQAEELLDELSPSAVISIEKIGRNEKGVYHTLYGSDMSASTAKADILVELARKRGIFTVGIGDLGNEIGMGTIKDLVRRLIPTGAKCRCQCGAGVASVVETDVGICASVSNLGAYAINACLCILLRRPELLQNAIVEDFMVKESLRLGALDGVCGSSLSVDGVPLADYIRLLETMRSMVRLGLSEEFFPPFATIRG